MPNAPIRPEMYDMTPCDHDRRERPPSETRDFAPTPVGWVGIVVLTVMLGWLIFRAGSDDADAG